MNTCKIPRTDLVVSRLAYGCASLTAWSRDAIGAGDIAGATQVIDTARDCGINLFDHADIYALGRAEALFGKVLAQSPSLRDEIVIQSKCGMRMPEGWTPEGPQARVGIDLTGEHIVRSVEGSLERLGTDRLDILLLHVADALVQPQEVAQAFDELHRDGKVSYFGVSNHNATQIELLQKDVRQRLVVNQIRAGLGYSYPLAYGMDSALHLVKGPGEGAYSPIAGDATVDYCRLNDIQIQAYSPLRGELAPYKPVWETQPGLDGVAPLLMDLAKRKGCAPSAVALAWLLRHPAAIVPIIGSSKPHNIRENCDAERVVLNREEWYALFAAVTKFQPR